MARILSHPGERLKTLAEENYELRRDRMLMRQRLITLGHRLDMAQKELSLHHFDITAIPPIPMTKKVSAWISEYGVPWEALYCPECRSWFIELDNSFPYHLECCVCRCDIKKEEVDDKQATEPS